MNPVTETLLRRAGCQVLSLARQNAHCVFTDRRNEGAASVVASQVNITQTHKTFADLPGPSGYPVIGTAHEYFRKPNRGQMHEVQVRQRLYILQFSILLTFTNILIKHCFFVQNVM